LLLTFPVYHKSRQLFITSYNTRASGHAYPILNGKGLQENCRQLRPV